MAVDTLAFDDSVEGERMRRDETACNRAFMKTLAVFQKMHRDQECNHKPAIDRHTRFSAESRPHQAGRSQAELPVEAAGTGMSADGFSRESGDAANSPIEPSAAHDDRHDNHQSRALVAVVIAFADLTPEEFESVEAEKSPNEPNFPADAEHNDDEKRIRAANPGSPAIDAATSLTPNLGFRPMYRMCASPNRKETPVMRPPSVSLAHRPTTRSLPHRA